MADSEPNIYKLEGVQEQKGGLIIKKKTDDDQNFKKPPKASLLGLDKLASQRRREKSEEIDAKKSKLDKDRHYRKPLDETPTHTGGVSYEARKRAEERYERHRERGIHVSTKDEKKYKDKYERDDRSRNYRRDDRDRDRDRDRNRDRDRDRDRYDKYNDRRGSERSYRSRGSETPRFKDEPLTPYYNMRDPISKTGWEDDDAPVTKRSAWDYPTPAHEKRSDWSHRSERSRRYDETPRPTPAFRYNAWAQDRKKSGATPLPGELLYLLFSFNILKT